MTIQDTCLHHKHTREREQLVALISEMRVAEEEERSTARDKARLTRDLEEIAAARAEPLPSFLRPEPTDATPAPIVAAMPDGPEPEPAASLPLSIDAVEVMLERVVASADLLGRAAGDQGQDQGHDGRAAEDTRLLNLVHSAVSACVGVQALACPHKPKLQLQHRI